MEEKEEYLDFDADDGEMKDLNQYVYKIILESLTGKEKEEFIKNIKK